VVNQVIGRLMKHIGSCRVPAPWPLC